MSPPMGMEVQKLAAMASPMGIEAIDPLENIFSMDDPSYIMYLPIGVTMDSVICLYMYFLLSFIIQLSIMFHNGFGKINRFSLKFIFNNKMLVFNHYLFYIKKNKLPVVFSLFVIMSFRYFVYNMFGALGTYNTITVVVFIISHF
jgi:hypothetical protein